MARYHAPGRVNLIGERTGYAGGLVLTAAIGRGLTCAASPRPASGCARPSLPAWSMWTRAAAERPTGLAATWPPWRWSLRPSAAGLDLEQIALAEACRRAEERAVGVPFGIMDPAASLLGRAGHALLLDCATLAHRLVPLPADLGLIAIDSGVPRRMAETGYGLRRAELERALAGDLRPPPAGACATCAP